MILDLSKVYYLTEGYCHNAVRVRRATDTQPISAVNGASDGQEHVFQVYAGKKFYDIIGTTSALEILISSKFADIIRSSDFQGYNLSSVKIHMPDENRRDDYFLLSIYGHCGALNDNDTNTFFIENEGGIGKTEYYTGFLFDPDSWDGSDLFSPDGSELYFVTESVKLAIDRARLTNVSLRYILHCPRLKF
jgi:hypothetical protein